MPLPMKKLIAPLLLLCLLATAVWTAPARQADQPELFREIEEILRT